VRKKSILSLAIGWTFLIAVLCLYRFGDLPKIKVNGIDKYVHFTFHFVFTFLWGYYVWLHHYRITLKKLLIIVLISLGYGILLEVFQEIFTQTRQADIMDVLANFTGAVTAFLVFVWVKKIKKV
jgi:VanZ family protein